jgi:hypothetical protein
VGFLLPQKQKFFRRTEEAEIEFQKGTGGIVSGMTIYKSDGSVFQGSRTDVASRP